MSRLHTYLLKSDQFNRVEWVGHTKTGAQFGYHFSLLRTRYDTWYYLKNKIISKSQQRTKRNNYLLSCWTKASHSTDTYTPLIVFTTALLLGLAFVAAGGGGTTRGATPSLTLYTDDDDFDGHTRFQGYVSGQDYCFTCGDGPDDDGTLGYCWNNKECPPACGNARGVSGRMDGECGTACQTFKFSSSWLKSSYTDKD